jgi:hypothetical protein
MHQLPFEQGNHNQLEQAPVNNSFLRDEGTSVQVSKDGQQTTLQCLTSLQLPPLGDTHKYPIAHLALTQPQLSWEHITLMEVVLQMAC